MQLKKFVSLMLSAATAVGCMISTASGAQASNLTSGVALGGSYKGTSVYVSSDPLYQAGYPAYLVNTLKPGRLGSGWNLPAIDSGDGILPDIGNFNELDFYYDVPNFGPNADNNIAVVIQTSDGFSRIAGISSFLNSTGNGYNGWGTYLYPSNFSPSFSPNQTVLRTVSIRYNGGIGPIYLVYPYIYGQNNSLNYASFNYKTLPDPRFNNQ